MIIELGQCLMQGDFSARGEKYFHLLTDAYGDTLLWTNHLPRIIADRKFSLVAIVVSETAAPCGDSKGPLLETGGQVKIIYSVEGEGRVTATMELLGHPDTDDSTWCLSPFFRI